MNKTDLINSIAAKSGLNKKNSEAALNAFIESVEGALKKGEKVVLVGFGTFEVRKPLERAEILRLKRKSLYLLQTLRYLKQARA
jgi:nucleoid DNA-binding protein